jgi:hypothetical protein
MSDFDYTDFAEFSSSLVDQAWYDSVTRTLAVDLNDSVYVYENMDQSTFDGLVKAPSAGRFYGQNIRGNKGRYAGDVDDFYVRERELVSHAAPNGIVPKNLHMAEGVTPRIENGTMHFSMGAPATSTHASGGVTDVKYFSLSTPEAEVSANAESPMNSYGVLLEVTVDSDNDVTALAEVVKHLDALNLNFKVFTVSRNLV